MSAILPENMNIVVLLSLVALVSATEVNPPPRSVNVALETSFLFDPKDMKDNKSFVNHIRRFLDKLYAIMDPQAEKKQFRTETEPQVRPERKLGEFIEVIQSIGENFLNMTSPKIKEALDTIHVEVKNISENQQTIISQVLPPTSQGVMKDLVDTWSWMHNNPEEVKVFINSTVRENKPLLKIFARRMNSYYNADDVRQLNKILKKFKRYIDTNKDTKKIVKKLLHNTIFKKYDNLNESTKAALTGDLKMLSEFLVPKNGLTGPETRRNSPNHEVENKAAFPDDITYTARRAIDEKIKNSRENNENEEKKGTNDLVAGKVE